MGDRNRDPHPDSLPSDNHDVRVDVTQGTTGANHDVENLDGGTGGASSSDEASDESVAAPDGDAATGGVTRNPDDPSP